MNSDPALISIRVAEFCHYFLPATGPYIRLTVVDVRRHVGNGNQSSIKIVAEFCHSYVNEGRVGVHVFAVFRGSGLGTAWPVGVGVCVFAVFRGNVLGTAWPVGVGVYVFAVFRGSGLFTAWPVGVGVYVFAVFRGSGLGTAWPVGVGVCAFAVFRWNVHYVYAKHF